ncbi:MAG: HlyD family efflux transporter periplasmic adaptor subunit, partial [Xanthomonadales bacterium]|nr:HlyD family efflux transporter periplasmic adaptor subunit [Xanthomonadales bacterium]
MDIKRTDQKARKRRQRILLGSAAAIVIALGTWGVASLEPAAPRVERASVWTDTVKRGEFLRQVRGPGTLVPVEIRWIAAETNARVERILVKPGAQVQTDTVLLELSNPEVADQLLAARSAVAAAEADFAARRITLESQLLDQRANLAGFEADHAGARLQAEAEGQLNAKGIISDLTYQRSKLQADQLALRVRIEKERVAKFEQSIRAQLDADRARIEQLQNTLSLRERQADALRVKAGLDGVLQQVPVEEGQQVLAGSNLARVARPDELMAELRIAETQAKDIRIDQVVAVDTRNGIVPGTVSRIDPAVQNGTVQVDVVLIGDLPPGARPDLSVDGTIEIERVDDAVFVGRPAFGQPDSQTTLFKLDPDSGTATRVPVMLGRASVNLIEIR